MNSSPVGCAGRTTAEGAHRARYVTIRIRRAPLASLAVLSLCGALLCIAPAPAADRFAGMRQDVAAGWRGADPTLLQGATAAGDPLLTIRQTQSRAILNWKQFDINAGETVYFDQQGNSGWAALNRIGGSDPSRIAGALKADGQVYLINQNGILFATGAQVDVHSLVASSLDISDDTFNSGITSLLPGAVAFAGGSGFVEVEAGAELKSKSGGQIMLLAPDVKNSGAILTPNGQTILAAGEKIYLSLPPDATSGVRGFLVEVDNGGSAQNLNLGSIIAERGNVTLAGLAVNQSGLVRATTSVNVNGSIKLLARERSGALADGKTVIGRTGTVVLGKDSVTEVLPDLADAQTSQDAQTFVKSDVEIAGKSIDLQANSTVRATGGTVTLAATPDKDVTDTAGVRIYLDAGSRIDVAGSQDVEVAMERNVVAVELRGTELADNPLARNGPLKGQTVYVDVREGTPFADISGYTAQIERTVGERTAAGGTVNLSSGGDIVLRQGSTLDVSGGSLRYLDGYIKTTQLVSDGRIYDIADASPNRVYQGTTEEYSVSNYKWGITETFKARARGTFMQGYLEGKDAGTIGLQARGLVLDGALIGTTTPGQWQRENGKLPLGGQLIVGNAPDENAPAGGIADYETPSVVFAAQKHLLPENFSFASALPQSGGSDFGQATTFSTELLRGGISRVAVYSNGSITVPAGVDVAVAPGGSVKLDGRTIDVQGNIDAPAGSIALVAENTFGSDTAYPDAADHGINVGEGGRLSTRGLWSNDLPLMDGALTGPVLPNGGAISLDSAADVSLASGSLLDVSGGGWLHADNKLQAGNAGSIVIKTGRFGLSGEAVAQTSTLVLGGELRGYALGKGGTLSLDTSLVRIGGTASAATDGQLPGVGFNLDASLAGIGETASGTPNELLLGADFFRQGGFDSYSVNGQDGLTLAFDTALTVQTTTLVLDHDYAAQRSGADVLRFSHAEVPLPHLRRATKVALSANSRDHGDVVVEDGASVGVDAGGSIKLNAGHQLTVLGTLQALAGTIALTTPVAGDKDAWDPAQSIWLGSGAKLMAGGTARILASAEGLRQGDVLPGGTIAINAGKGYVVTEAGSLMDVSGAQDTLDVLQQQGSATTYAPAKVTAAAGSINIAAREGMLLNGSLRGAAAALDAAGGALSLEIGRPTSPLILPNGPVSIVVSQKPQAFPDGPAPEVVVADKPNDAGKAANNKPNPLAPGDAIPDELNGKAFVAADAVRDGGFDAVVLKSQNAIAFDGKVDLAPRRSITLDAPDIAGDAAVRVGAAYAAIGTSVRNQPPSAASGGSGSFTVSAGLIDLQGDTALQGFGKVALASTGDIRLKGLYDPKTSTLPGSLSSGADRVTLYADQIYPTTLSRYTLALDNNPAGVIAIKSGTGGSPVLSAGGGVTVRAPVIEQGGVLKAPLGEIVLDAASSLTLASGGVTSVSAEGQSIPFGKTDLSGRNWVYGVTATDMLAQETPPEKRISLSAPSVDIKSGATLDVSGGGDLYAYEFTKGPGGSRDVLDATPGTFAILPALGTGTAPYDQQYFIGSDLKPGDSVYLSGVDGLKAGMYALLPARYALLPGALLVTAVAGKQDMLPGQVVQNVDGTQVVAGYRAVLGADGALLARDARNSGFLVRAGSMARTQSGYSDTLASGFFAEKTAAQQPGDAGRLSIAATTAMALGGTLKTGFADGGRGAEVDVTAPKMAVVSDSASDVDAGFVKLDAATLNGWKAASLLLGGTRESTADGVVVHVGAEQVVLANDADSALVGPEIMLAASDRVTLQAKSAIRGEGTFSGEAKDIAIGTGTTDGNGALVRVSSGAGVALTRGNANRSKGDLTVEQDALVSGNAITLDATHDNVFDGSIVVGANGALDLGAGRISLGDTADVTEGLVFSNDELAAFGNLGSLTLRSYSTLDLYGDVALGSSALGNLAVEAGGIGGYGGKAAVLTAQSVALANPNGTAFSSADDAPAPGTGKLSIAAQRVVLGAGAAAVAGEEIVPFEIKGFSGVNIAADKEIVGRGRGALNVAGDLAMTATRLTGETGARQTITAAGKLSYAQPVVLAALDPLRGLGARFDLAAASIDIAGRVELPAGTLNLRATGPAASDGVKLSSGAWIDATGASRAFADTVAYAPAGSVTLTSDNGDVAIDAGARVDVSGAQGGGDAGTVAMTAAKGTAVVEGTLLGHAHASTRQGSFIVDAGKLQSGSGNALTGLNDVLTAGGFDELRDLRIRTGDMVLEADGGNIARAKAHTYRLVADGGSIDVYGTVDSSGDKGGSIVLAARDYIDLRDGALLDAHATGAGNRGGKVTLVTTSLNAKRGIEMKLPGDPNAYQIDVRGGAGNEQSGSVLLRAPRLVSDANAPWGDEVAVNLASGSGFKVNGVAEVVVEAVKTYDHGTATLGGAYSGNMLIEDGSVAAPGVGAAARTAAWTVLLRDALSRAVAAQMGATGETALVDVNDPAVKEALDKLAASAAEAASAGKDVATTVADAASSYPALSSLDWSALSTGAGDAAKNPGYVAVAEQAYSSPAALYDSLSPTADMNTAVSRDTRNAAATLIASAAIDAAAKAIKDGLELCATCVTGVANTKVPAKTKEAFDAAIKKIEADIETAVAKALAAGGDDLAAVVAKAAVGTFALSPEAFDAAAKTAGTDIATAVNTALTAGGDAGAVSQAAVDALNKALSPEKAFDDVARIAGTTVATAVQKALTGGGDAAAVTKAAVDAFNVALSPAKAFNDAAKTAGTSITAAVQAALTEGGDVATAAKDAFNLALSPEKAFKDAAKAAGTTITAAVQTAMAEGGDNQTVAKAAADALKPPKDPVEAPAEGYKAPVDAFSDAFDLAWLLALKSAGPPAPVPRPYPPVPVVRPYSPVPTVTDSEAIAIALDESAQSAAVQGAELGGQAGYRAGVAANAQARNIVVPAAIKQESEQFAVAAANIAARLGSGVHVRAGAEIRSSGDLTLDSDWNLYSASRPGGEPGVLTLRAAGDLKLNKSLSDGFLDQTTFIPQAGPSWSYRLVAGADQGSADPLAVLPLAELATDKGSVRVVFGKSAAPIRVRTGTGSIDMAAGRDVVLGNQYSVIYTAGVPVILPPDAIFPTLALANFTNAGGDILIRAGGDVKGALSTQLVSEWLFRRGSLDGAGNIDGKPDNPSSATNTAWGINFRDFQQSVGALGGGDVTVLAGGNVENLSVVIPTNGRLLGAIGSKPDAANLDINGGGDLTVRAGGDIQSGLFYVAQGQGYLAAGGSVAQSSSAKLHTVLALGQGEFAVTAGDALELETVLNPTVLKQAKANGTTNNASFFTYGPDSAVSLTAVAGDLVLANDVAAMVQAYPSNKTLETLLTAYPGTLLAAALSGDVAVKAGFAMFPAANGNLELLADGGVSILGTINVSDVDPARISSALAPFPASTLTGTTSLLNPTFDKAMYHSDPALHRQDDAPIRIVAASGSIAGNGNRSVLLPKQAIVQAALDIRDFSVQGQNLRETDTTSLVAGRDVLFDSAANSNSRIQLDGPGRLVVAAGRDVDLGASYGIVTRGNVGNPYLPEGGAGVTVLAGLGTGADGFARMPDYAGFAAYAAEHPNPSGKTYASLEQAFYGELQQSGREAKTLGGDYSRGYDAIAALFPEQSYQGDVNLFFSQIKTQQGGDIDIMAPGGLVNAGLANPGSFTKKASELGIVTVGGGSVHAFARDDFLVNQSRVFTLQGGDILIWSSLGNIDAGKGSKTASATPPPQLRVDANGQFVLDTTQSIAGSGIGVLLGNEGVTPGDVDLIAPVGEVNAGDAGIRAAGNLNIAALRVVGADNIQVGGISTGVPVADTGGVGAGLTGASGLANPGNSAEDATKSLAESGKQSEQAMERMKQALADFKPSFLTVEVIGLGDEDDEEEKRKRRKNPM